MPDGQLRLELSDDDKAVVRAHLSQILASDAFKGGKRAQEFLALVVEHALEGRWDSLKERMLGAEMFKRPVDYDTANDAVVRVKASEVRRRLAQYYQSLSGPSSVSIDLPAGTYVARFFFAAPFVVSEEVSPDSPPNEEQVAANAVPISPPVPTRRRRLVAIAGVVVLAALAVAGYLIWRRPALFTGQDAQIRSIAILPLVNLSGDPAQEYFADGMTEELTTELGQIGSLRVISRTSTMTYKGTKKTVPQIARELQVDALVEGSIEREKDRVRITTQLIDARTDHHIWAKSYDREMTDVLELQSEVAQAIAKQIQAELTPAEQAHFHHVQNTDPQAVELYLQGMQRLGAGSPQEAAEYFKKSIAKDPSYAAAHASLANAYGWMGEAGWMAYEEAFTQQTAEAQKAIELDDSRPEPHLELGIAAMNQSWDWETQRREFEQALMLNKNSTAVHWGYASYLMRVGETQRGIEEGKTALLLDPVSSRSFMNLAFDYYYGRQYDMALEEMRRAAELEAHPQELRFPLGVIYIEKGFLNEGIQELQQLGDVPHALGHMGNAYARQGQNAKAASIIAQLKQHVEKSGIGRYEIALVYAGMHRNDDAFAWLDKAYTVHDKGLTYLLIDPCLDPLRKDPRFGDLVKRWDSQGSNNWQY